MDNERGVSLARMLPSNYNYDGLFLVEILLFLLFRIWWCCVLHNRRITDAQQGDVHATQGLAERLEPDNLVLLKFSEGFQLIDMGGQLCISIRYCVAAKYFITAVSEVELEGELHIVLVVV